MKVLIVDDEKNIRFILNKFLNTMQIDVEEAINGEDALEKFAPGKYNIVFLDLRMPGIDGLEVLKSIKEQDSEVAVIIITAHGTVDNAVEAMKLGAVDFLQKPFTPKEIKAVVEKITKEQSPETVPESYDDFITHSKQLISQQKYDEAMEYLKKAIGLEPSGGEPHNIMGAILEIKGELEDAQKHYRVAITLNPEYTQAQRNLSRVIKKIKDKKGE